MRAVSWREREGEGLDRLPGVAKCATIDDPLCALMQMLAFVIDRPKPPLSAAKTPFILLGWTIRTIRTVFSVSSCFVGEIPGWGAYEKVQPEHAVRRFFPGGTHLGTAGQSWARLLSLTLTLLFVIRDQAPKLIFLGGQKM